MLKSKKIPIFFHRTLWLLTYSFLLTYDPYKGHRFEHESVEIQNLKQFYK